MTMFFSETLACNRRELAREVGIVSAETFKIGKGLPRTTRLLLWIAHRKVSGRAAGKELEARRWCEESNMRGQCGAPK